jgi:hypothetical protein
MEDQLDVKCAFGGVDATRGVGPHEGTGLDLGPDGAVRTELGHNDGVLARHGKEHLDVLGR